MATAKTIVRRLLVATVLLGAVTTACSLVVTNDTDQCSTDGDCASHGAGAVCRSGVCINASSPSNGGDGSTTCTPKTPVTQLDILNEPCTNATCISFDDCARLGICTDAGLPALITPGDGGVK